MCFACGKPAENYSFSWFLARIVGAINKKMSKGAHFSVKYFSCIIRVRLALSHRGKNYSNLRESQKELVGLLRSLSPART